MRTIAVASGKGGVGKSFVVSNLSIILSKCGFRVLTIDADVKLANLEIFFGIEGSDNTLQRVFKGEISIDEAVHSRYGVDIIPGGLSVENIYSNVRRFDILLYNIKEKEYDFVLIDCPAGLSEEAIAVITVSDNLLIVINPELTSVTDALKTKLVAEKVNTNVRGVVVNMVGKVRGELTKSQIEEVLGNVLAVIPFDKAVGESISRGVPFVLYQPDSRITKEFVKLAEKITGVSIKVKKEGGLFRGKKGEDTKSKKFKGLFGLWI